MAAFNRFGVPWYASGETPAIRPKEFMFERDSSNQLNRYKANRYLHDYFRANWKKGDRFILTEPVEQYDMYSLLKNPDEFKDRQFVTWSGEFIEKKDCGMTYFIYVKFDEGQKRRTGSRFGMFNFYHLAEKCNEC